LARTTLAYVARARWFFVAYRKDIGMSFVWSARAGSQALFEIVAGRHIARAVINAKLILHPYPHIYVRDIFPDALYESMERDLPSNEAWETAAEYAPQICRATPASD
jgi:hypothetical protein